MHFCSLAGHFQLRWNDLPGLAELPRRHAQGVGRPRRCQAVSDAGQNFLRLRNFLSEPGGEAGEHFHRSLLFMLVFMFVLVLAERKGINNKPVEY